MRLFYFSTEMVVFKIIFSSILLFNGNLFCQVKTCIVLDTGDTINCTDLNGKQGLWRTYKGKRLISEITYLNNRKHGYAAEYFSRKTYLKQNYVYDIITDSSLYYKDARLIESKVYDSSGTLKSSSLYYKNGKIKYITHYITINNRLYPLISSFYRNGQVKAKNDILDSGGHVTTTYFKRNGEKR